jgi:hypothetical protein
MSPALKFVTSNTQFVETVGDLWRSGLAPVSAAGNECAAGSAVVRTTVAAKNFQTGMRRLMNRSSGFFSEFFGFLPSLSW